MAKIDAFFKLMNEQGASDLHLTSGQPPALRIRGDIERIKYKVLDNDDLRGMLYEIAPEQKIKLFEETGDVDFGYEIPGLARSRSNFFTSLLKPNALSFSNNIFSFSFILRYSNLYHQEYRNIQLSFANM